MVELHLQVKGYAKIKSHTGVLNKLQIEIRLLAYYQGLECSRGFNTIKLINKTESCLQTCW